MYKSVWVKIMGLFCIIFGVGVFVWACQTLKINDTYDMIRYAIPFFTAPILFLIEGICLIYRHTNDAKTAEILSRSGRYIDAEITKIIPYYNRYGHFSKVRCEYIDNVTGEKHTFESEVVCNSPEGIKDLMEKENIKTLKIKVSENMKRYEMDVMPITASYNLNIKVDDKFAYTVIFLFAVLIIIALGGYVLCYFIPKKTNENLDNGKTPIEQNTQNINETENKEEEIESNEEDEQEEQEQDNTPFVAYDDSLRLLNKNLKIKADKIDSKLRRVIAIIALNSFKDGKYTLKDMDKVELNGLIVNNMFDEEYYEYLEEIDITVPYLIEASKYENVFKQVTGMADVTGYFKGLDYSTQKDEKKSAYIEYNGKTYYIGKWGFGMEGKCAVITNISYSGTKTITTIKVYDIDYNTNKVSLFKTVAFELETNGLRIYNYTVSK